MTGYTGPMRTLSLAPAQVAINIVSRGDRQLGMLTVVGSGETAETIIELVFDAAGLAALEATVGEARSKLRHADAGH